MPGLVIALLLLALGAVIGGYLVRCWLGWTAYSAPSPRDAAEVLHRAQAMRDIDDVASAALASMRAVVNDHLRGGRRRRG